MVTVPSSLELQHIHELYLFSGHSGFEAFNALFNVFWAIEVSSNQWLVGIRGSKKKTSERTQILYKAHACDAKNK